MKNPTRIAYAAYLTTLASLNGVASATEKFTVAPSVQQTLETKIQESSDFLGRINIVPVTEQKGEKIGLGIGGTIASTTNTANTDRNPVDPSNLEGNDYECTQTNFDTALKYAKLDMWAKFPDFQTRLRDSIVNRQALDRILIGFNGTSRAATSDRAANPLLQDVNKGWIQHYREQAAARVMHQGANVNQVRVGAEAGADYANLDALVFDAVNSLIEPVHQEDTQLVVICGRNLLADKYFPILNQAQPNSESLAADLIISQKRIGGLSAARVPGFPANALMVTRLDNLSIYYQEGARRRSVIDNAKRDQIENYESSNDAYVVEDFGLGCVVENITLAW
jgi:P2 family phage major capsid protein